MRIVVVLILISLFAGACTGRVTLTSTLIPSPVPSPTASPLPTLRPASTSTASPTPTSTPILIDPLTGAEIEPPLDIDLPEGWRLGYDSFLFSDLGDLTVIPLAIYRGPVTGGTGEIILLWNFRSVTTGNPLSADFGVVNPWVDGLRLLRLAVFSPDCNIGTDVQRPYSVGGLDATGTRFAAVDCPDGLPDTRGWFAGLEQSGIPFVFYVYADPIDAMNGPARDEMQAILDSVDFRVQAFLDALPTYAPGQPDDDE